VADALAEFLWTLVPAQFDRAVASKRKEGIERLLSTAAIKSDYLFESGSWSHGTAIAAKSDVDYVAWIDSARPSLPSSALSRLRQVIDESSYLDVYKVRTSSPVVSVEFYRAPHFEIVPAYYQRSVGDTLVFWIPGRGDEWVLSAPDAHLDYVNHHNDRLGKQVKPLVRLVKAWKYFAEAPVSSFYLEMRTAEYAAGESSIWFDIDLPAVFRRIIASGARDMNDPEGLVGRIPSCSSDEKRTRTLSLMRDVVNSLDLADDAKRRGNPQQYWSNMYDVFGPNFPYPTGW
jgi:hypothetical protein